MEVGYRGTYEKKKSYDMEVTTLVKRQLGPKIRSKPRKKRTYSVDISRSESGR